MVGALCPYQKYIGKEVDMSTGVIETDVLLVIAATILVFVVGLVIQPHPR